MANKTLIRNAQIVTLNAHRDVLTGDILIRGGRIQEVGSVQDPGDCETLEASGLTVVPGFVQPHIHLCQTLFRNLADDLELLDWLRLKIWPYESAHTPETIALSAQMGLAELIKCGTTTIMDMGTVHHTDQIFEQIERSGIRAFAGKAMMDQTEGAPRGLSESMQWSLEESLRLKNTWDGAANGRLKYAFAPRFVLSCSDKLLRELGTVASSDQTIIHTHASENKSELETVRKLCKMDNVEYFHSIDLTGPQLCMAHCIHLNPGEYDIIRETDSKVMHCPSSNLKLGSGIASVPEMLGHGITVSLGADGAPCNNNLDIFVEMRLAALIQKPRLGPKSITAQQVFEMATLGGARTLGLQDEIGSIEPGKKADLTLLDLGQIHNVPFDNVYSQIVYSAQASNVRTVLCDGRIILQNRELRNLDEAVILSKISGALKTIDRNLEGQVKKS